MAKRKSFISIDFSNFSAYAEELEHLGADLQRVFTEVMEEEAKTIQSDTINALSSGNLPAQGRYSKGTTKSSVDLYPKVEWSGSIGEVGLGFDKTKPGAGGFLITGTPRMQPDHALEQIYGRKTYENKVNRNIMKRLQSEIDKRLK